MLYVFHVDVGRMINFDMNVAMSSVENLKDTIERLHGIPAANIVLLVSGGEMLTMSTQVSYYSAGTDTNPIYMFLTGDMRLPVEPQPNPAADLDLTEQVERCLALPAVYETVVTRAQLALRMYEMARDEERLCERLVHEQHLQQQGWSAVVANMEDLTEEFRQRFHNFCNAFDQHLAKRNHYLELLRHFGHDLNKLSHIPILPGLMALAEQDFHGFDEYLEQDEVFSRSTAQHNSVLIKPMAGANNQNQYKETTTTDDVNSRNSNNASSTSPNKKLKMGNESTTTTTTDTEHIEAAPITTTKTTATITKVTNTTTIKAEIITTTTTTTTTNSSSSMSTSSSTKQQRRNNVNLLQWITSKENHNTLKLMSDECIQALGTFNAEVYEQLKYEVMNIIKLADQSDIKEIKGLGERLCKLEEFKYKIKNMVQDQKELSTAFQYNQQRANNLRDPTILHDLCISHQSQMQVMLQNHLKIRDHRKIIARAKDELGGNLAMRLQRIVCIENAMSDFDNRLLFYLRCLRRAERHIHIIEQIHQAPGIYVAAVTEVVRRKIFSGEFRLWATKLSDDFESIHSEEIKRRELFNSSFEGHFLNILFPGMSDMPPAFANETPLIFDARLPNLTRSDLDVLSPQLTELTPQITLPDMGPVINFFVSHSGEHQMERLEQLIRQQILTTTAADDKKIGCEVSTTATDADENEFEKVGTIMSSTSGVDASILSATNTKTPNTAEISINTDPLPLTQNATTLTEEALEELSALAEVKRLRGVLGNMSQLALQCISTARVQMANVRTDTTNLREQLESDLQLLQEKSQLMRLQVVQRDCELQTLRDSLKEREETHAAVLSELRVQSMELEAQLLQARADLDKMAAQQETAVAQAREQLTHEHKTELEALRCRFKLMTSMDAMPSPTESSGGIVEKSGNFLSFDEHENILREVRANLENERERAVSAAMETERSMWQSKMFSLQPESLMANVNVLREMLEEKERQLEMLRERDLMQTKENYQLKTRLDALTNEEGNSWMKEKIEFLNRDKNRLEEELNMERSRRVGMETSIANIRSSSALSSSNSAVRQCASSYHNRCISLDSCSKGDIVFVIWSMRHGQYVVVQDSSSLYFVHGDSLTSLNLPLPPTTITTTTIRNTLTDANSASASDGLPTVPLPFYGIGRVIDKEYCAARKDENRYRVTKGSRFYRIKLAPLSPKSGSRRDRIIDVSRSISQSDMIPQQQQQQQQLQQQESFYVTTVSPVAGIKPSRSMNSAALNVNMMPILAAAVSKTATETTTTTMSKDVIDHSCTLAIAAPIGIAGGNCGVKERTISVTSVTTDDGDEPLSLLSDGGSGSGAGAGALGFRYLSVSEEDEDNNALSAYKEKQEQQQQQQSVITEQPTSTTLRSLLEQQKYLMLENSAILPQNNNNKNLTQQHEEKDIFDQQIIIESESTITTTLCLEQQAIKMIDIQEEKLMDEVKEENLLNAEDKKCEETHQEILMQVEEKQDKLETTTTTPKEETLSTISESVLPMSSPIHQNLSGATISIATISEDSDEYRSLEPKDDEVDG